MGVQRINRPQELKDVTIWQRLGIQRLGAAKASQPGGHIPRAGEDILIGLNFEERFPGKTGDGVYIWHMANAIETNGIAETVNLISLAGAVGDAACGRTVVG